MTGALPLAARTCTSILPQDTRLSAGDVGALIRPDGQGPTAPGRRQTPPAGHPEFPPDRKASIMTSTSQPLDLTQYLARCGFAPSPENPAWLDLGAGHQSIRVLHEPGETTVLYCLGSRGCLYEAVFSPGAPDAVITAAVEAALGPPSPQASRGHNRAAPGQPCASEGKR